MQSLLCVKEEQFSFNNTFCSVMQCLARKDKNIWALQCGHDGELETKTKKSCQNYFFNLFCIFLVRGPNDPVYVSLSDEA